MRDVHPFVELLDHHRFDDGQQFGRGGGRDAKGVSEGERGTEIPADHGAGHNP